MEGGEKEKGQGIERQRGRRRRRRRGTLGERGKIQTLLPPLLSIGTKEEKK